VNRSDFFDRPAAVLVPMLFAILAYAGTLDADFIFDDKTQIVNNPFVVELRHFWHVVTNPVWDFKHTTPGPSAASPCRST